MRKIYLLLISCLIYSCTKDLPGLSGQSDSSIYRFRLELNSDITDQVNTQQSTRAILPEDVAFENTIQDVWIVVSEGTSTSSPIMVVEPLSSQGGLYGVKLNPGLFDESKTYNAYIVANINENKAAGDLTSLSTFGDFESFKLKPAMTSLNSTVQAPPSLVKISSACNLTVISKSITLTDTSAGATAGSVKMTNVASRLAVLSDAFQTVSSITIDGVSSEGTLLGQSSSATTTITDTKVGIEGSSAQKGYYYVYPNTSNSMSLSIDVVDKGTGTFTLAKALVGGTTYIVNSGTRITGVFPHAANTVEWSLDSNKNSYIKLLGSSQTKFDLTFSNDASVSVKDPTASPWLSVAVGTSRSVDIVSGGVATVTAAANTTEVERVGTLVCEYTINGVAKSYEMTVKQPAYTKTFDNHLVIGYFPSWSDNSSADKLLGLPEEVTYIFLCFAKSNMTYTKGSYDIGGTGLNLSYDGAKLKSVISTLHARNVKVILSIGGETYWNTSAAYNIDYQQIADFVRDLGFDGVDWDYEPSGRFDTIGNPTEVQHFIDMISSTRTLLPRSEGFEITCAPAGCGALGGVTNDDPSSPYRYANRATMTGESEAYTSDYENGNSVSLYGFQSTGHMIPVFQAVGDQIDFVAFQGYNVGAATQRELMYDSYAYYGNLYGFRVAAGMHVPEEPWGPVPGTGYYKYTPERVAYYANYVANGGRENRKGKGDGVMFWELLMESALDPSVDGIDYCQIAYDALDAATPLISPSVAITSPNGGPTKVSTSLTVEVSAKRVTKVDIYLDDVLKTTLTAEPYSYGLGTLALGEHVIKAVGTNEDSGETATASVTVKTVSDNSLELYPNWSSGGSYNNGDYVVYDNCLWLATGWVAVGEHPGSGYWVYQYGGSGQPAYPYNSAYVYVGGALVTYNGSTYKAAYFAAAGEYPGKISGQWAKQ